MIAYIIIGIILLVIIVYTFVVYNSFIRLENRVKEAFATMDVFLKKRWDLIPNLVETVKGYSKHENETLKEVIGMRSGSYDKMSVNEKLKTNEKISVGIDKIMMLVEQYPELKASDNYKELSKELVNVENDIANSRKYYNGCVRIFNNKVEMFPSNIFAKIFRYKSKLMFAADKEEREKVDVEL